MNHPRKHRDDGPRSRCVLTFIILGMSCFWMGGGSLLACPPYPYVEAIGSRYLAITPQEWEFDVAIQVIGFPCIGFGVPQPCPGVECPIVDCVGPYVQADGVLGSTPYYQSVEDWGTIYVRGIEIVPDALYTARAVDYSGPGPAVQLAKTWKWCDTDNDCDVDMDDINCQIDVFKGIITEECTLEAADVTSPFAPCGLPDRVVDFYEISLCIDAYHGAPCPCEDPCPPGSLEE